MVTAQPRKTYFKGFNALRFYAALSVIVQHLSYSPHDWYGVPLLPVTLERLFLNGADAVNLFFILSGFLITYLLLTEHDRTGGVSVRNFYVRRAFRIYPVYFVYLLVVVVLLRPRYSSQLLPLLIFFMGNVAYVHLFPFPPLEHLWSIGVEEQYYLLAPLLARYKNRIAGILVFIVLVWWAVLVLAAVLPQTPITAFVLMSRYDLIAIGALTAYAYYHHWRILRYIGHPAAMWVAGVLIGYAIVFVAPTMFAAPTMSVFYTTLLGLAFVVLIYQVAASPRLPGLLQNRLLEFLGNLSYSMYVYHPLFVLLYHRIFYERLPLAQYQLVGYPLIIGMTIAVSLVSYKLLESPFLRFKNRFTSSPRMAASLGAAD